ncbi:MAG: prepilin-type N-terminal cleavage/methylation domain-containing protein [Verrucomicrobiota bacterium]|nr:prepilin-type N-terminal cleavage/methylation domain-containing protein [Verrucomicrobiota bacterium]
MLTAITTLAHGFAAKRSRAFTLIELLVVIIIIGILATIGIPALKGFTNTNSLAAAHRQLLDDISFARQRAMAERSSVYLVFLPPQVARENWNSLNSDEKRALTNLINGQYTSYAFYSTRGLGDQPGSATKRYLSEWKSLPEGVFISTNKFNTNAINEIDLNKPLPFAKLFPFPLITSSNYTLPYIGFNYQGQMLHGKEDLYLTLTKGTVIFPRNDDGSMRIAPAEVIEMPKGNYTNNPAIRVDWLTGRPRTQPIPPRT